MTDPFFSIGEFKVHMRDGLLFRRGRRICVQPQPMKALLYLIGKRGNLVTRQELAKHLWPGDFVDDGQSLNVVIRNLRRTLGDNSKAPIYIETVPTKGYRLVGGDVKQQKRLKQFLSVALVAAAFAVVFSALTFEWSAQSDRPSSAPMAELPLPAKLAYAKGRKHMRDNNMEAARAEMTKATALAPGFAEAYLWLAKTYSGSWGASLQGATLAEPLLLRSLEINPDLAEAYAELGNIALIKDLDAEKAYELAQTSLELDPQNISARFVQVDARLAMGRPKDALLYLEKISRIDPLRLTQRATEGWVAYMAGEFDVAARACHLALNSGASMERSARTCLMEVYLAQKREDLALEQAATLMALARAPDAVFEEFRQQSGRAAIEVYYTWRLETIRSNPGRSNPYLEAIYLLKLDHPDMAVSKLQEAVHQRQFPQIAFLKSDRRLHALSDHPSGGALFDTFRQ